VDHTFTWEKKGTTIDWKKGDPKGGTGAVRMTVIVKGREVGAYRHFLKVPEDFDRQLTRTLSIGGFIAVGAMAFMILLVIAAVVITIKRNKDGEIKWRPAFGWAAVTCAVFGASA